MEVRYRKDRSTPALPAAGGLTTVVGVDGCRAGWVAAFAEFADGQSQMVRLDLRMVERFDELLAPAVPPAMMAVDMPIGLPSRYLPGGRRCDQEARQLLGAGWTSSVFSPPARSALEASDHQHAMVLQGGGLSIQSFNIVPRIREIDAVIAPAHQAWIREAHPELAFRGLNDGRQLRHRKRTTAGQRERTALLRKVFGAALPDPAGVRLRLGPRGLAIDDVIDALMLADVARRIHRHEAHRVPVGDPPLDAHGLRMEIWF